MEKPPVTASKLDLLLSCLSHYTLFPTQKPEFHSINLITPPYTLQNFAITLRIMSKLWQSEPYRTKVSLGLLQDIIFIMFFLPWLWNSWTLRKFRFVSVRHKEILLAVLWLEDSSPHCHIAGSFFTFVCLILGFFQEAEPETMACKQVV